MQTLEQFRKLQDRLADRKDGDCLEIFQTVLMPTLAVAPVRLTNTKSEGERPKSVLYSCKRRMELTAMCALRVRRCILLDKRRKVVSQDGSLRQQRSGLWWKEGRRCVDQVLAHQFHDWQSDVTYCLMWNNYRDLGCSEKGLSRCFWLFIAIRSTKKSFQLHQGGLPLAGYQNEQKSRFMELINGDPRIWHACDQVSSHVLATSPL